ncbi:MAG: hypothetical protein ABI763_02665 [Bacteroidota bacterium]
MRNHCTFLLQFFCKLFGITYNVLGDLLDMNNIFLYVEKKSQIAHVKSKVKYNIAVIEKGRGLRSNFNIIFTLLIQYFKESKIFTLQTGQL